MAKRSSLIWVVALITSASGVAKLYQVMNPKPFERQRMLSEILPLEFFHFLRSSMLLIGFTLVIFGGVWVAMGIGPTAIFAPSPEDLIEAGETFGAVIALIVASFIYLVLRRPGPRRGGRPANRGLYRCDRRFKKIT
jgi:hypothetical protein